MRAAPRAKNLAHLTSSDRMVLRLIEPVQSLRRLSRITQVNNASNSSIRVYDSFTTRLCRPGKAREEPFTGLDPINSLPEGWETQADQEEYCQCDTAGS